MSAGLDPATLDPGEWPALVEATLRRNPEVRVAEVLNEPEHLFDLSPERYVREFLQPAYERIRDRVPGVAVVAAAPVGTRAVVADRFRRLTDAGADEFCDFRAVHVYFDDPRLLGTIAGATRRPILVTETGTSRRGPARALVHGRAPADPGRPRSPARVLVRPPRVRGRLSGVQHHGGGAGRLRAAQRPAGLGPVPAARLGGAGSRPIGAPDEP